MMGSKVLTTISLFTGVATKSKSSLSLKTILRRRMKTSCTARKMTNNELCNTLIYITLSFESWSLRRLFSLAMSITTVDKELLEAATLSQQAQERLTPVLHRKLKTNQDVSSKEGEI